MAERETIRFCDDLLHFVEPAADHPHVVLDDAGALGPELVFQLRSDGAEQRRVREFRLRHHGRSGEEGALESVALHAESQFGVGGLFPRNFESVEVVEADLAVDDEALVLFRRICHPDFLAHRCGTLQHEDAAASSGRRADWSAGRRSGSGDSTTLDVEVVAVDADGFGRRGQVVRRRLSLLLRAVLRIGLDLIARAARTASSPGSCPW